MTEKEHLLWQPGDIVIETAKYTPDQPRDEGGRFSDGGSSGSSAAPADRQRGQASMLRQRLNKNGGFSYQPTARTEPKDGLMVSRPGSELIIEKKPTVEQIRSYLAQHEAELSENTHIGGWFNPEDGKTYLDLSERVDSKEEAERLAIERKQEAYYDVATGETVYTRAREKAARWILSPRDDGRRDPAGDRPHLRRWQVRWRAAPENPEPVSIGPELYPDELNAAAEDAIRSYQTPFTESVRQTTIGLIKDAVLKAREEGGGVEQVLDAISPLFSPDRARTIAVTETTRLFGIGTQATFRAMGLEYWEWATAEDEAVCPICSDLDGEAFDIDTPFAPAHPNCRCYLSPVLSLDYE